MVTRAASRQFDVFANPDKRTADVHPYLIVLQSDAVSGIDTRVVAPLVSPKSIRFLEQLLPEVTVRGAKYVIAIPDMAAIPMATVGKPVANLEAERYRVLAAIDLLFTGI